MNMCVRLLQTPQAQQTSTFVLPQGGADPLTDMMSQLDQKIVGPHRQVRLSNAHLNLTHAASPHKGIFTGLESGQLRLIYFLFSFLLQRASWERLPTPADMYASGGWQQRPSPQQAAAPAVWPLPARAVTPTAAHGRRASHSHTSSWAGVWQIQPCLALRQHAAALGTSPCNGQAR